MKLSARNILKGKVKKVVRSCEFGGDRDIVGRSRIGLDHHEAICQESETCEREIGLRRCEGFERHLGS